MLEKTWLVCYTPAFPMNLAAICIRTPLLISCCRFLVIDGEDQEEPTLQDTLEWDPYGKHEADYQPFAQIRRTYSYLQSKILLSSVSPQLFILAVRLKTVCYIGVHVTCTLTNFDYPQL